MVSPYVIRLVFPSDAIDQRKQEKLARLQNIILGKIPHPHKP